MDIGFAATVGSRYDCGMELVIQQHIESVPGKCGGKPCIKGTRIRVWDIYVASELAGKTPAEILEDYPHINIADVHAALAYYWDNRQAIDAQMKAADDYVEQLKKELGPGPFTRKLAEMKTDGDAFSAG